MRKLKRKGATTLEYSLIAAFIAASSFEAVQYFGQNVSKTYCNTNNHINSILNKAQTKDCDNIQNNSTSPNDATTTTPGKTTKPEDNFPENKNLVWYGSPSSIAPSWTVSQNPSTQTATFTLQNMSQQSADHILPQMSNNNEDNPVHIVSSNCPTTLAPWGQCSVIVQSIVTKNGSLDATLYSQGTTGLAEDFNDPIKAFVPASSSDTTIDIWPNQNFSRSLNISTPNSDLDSVTINGTLPPGLSFGQTLNDISNTANSNNIILSGITSQQGDYDFTLNMKTRAGLSSQAHIHCIVH